MFKLVPLQQFSHCLPYNSTSLKLDRKVISLQFYMRNLALSVMLYRGKFAVTLIWRIIKYVDTISIGSNIQTVYQSVTKVTKYALYVNNS